MNAQTSDYQSPFIGPSKEFCFNSQVKIERDSDMIRFQHQRHPFCQSVCHQRNETKVREAHKDCPVFMQAGRRPEISYQQREGKETDSNHFYKSRPYELLMYWKPIVQGEGRIPYDNQDSDLGIQCMVALFKTEQGIQRTSFWESGMLLQCI